MALVVSPCASISIGSRSTQLSKSNAGGIMRHMA
jgi:hypothetical protein